MRPTVVWVIVYSTIGVCVVGLCVRGMPIRAALTVSVVTGVILGIAVWFGLRIRGRRARR
jgi:hypothetical protein